MSQKVYDTPVVVLAAGANTRFFPLNFNTHKSGVTLMGQTLIGRTLSNLAENGFQNVAIIISPKENETEQLKEAVQNSLQKHTALTCTWIEQPEAKGMGNALLCARDFLNQQKESAFAVIDPVNYKAGNILSKALDAHPEQPHLFGSNTTTPWLYGIAELDSDGNFINMVEKPPQRTEKTTIKVEGMYILNDVYLDILGKTTEEEYNFEVALNVLSEKGPIPFSMLEKEILSLKLPWQLLSFKNELLADQKTYRGNNISISSSAVLDESNGPIYIGDNVIIGHTTKVVGPAYIGNNSVVGDFSLVRQSVLEDNVKIGAYCDIARSIVMSETVFHNAYVADSIIGKNNQIGAGLITANKRINRETIRTMVKGSMVSTELSALGLITGENIQAGINVSTMPGVMVASNSIIEPGKTLNRNIT